MTTTTHYKVVTSELYRAFYSAERDNGQRFYLLKDNRPDWIGEDFSADFHDAVDGTTASNRRPPSDYVYELAEEMASHLEDCDSAAEAEERMFDAANGCVDIYTADKFKWACDMYNRWLIDEAAEEYGSPVKCSSYSQEMEHGIDRAQHLAAMRMGEHLLACVLAEVDRREASESEPEDFLASDSSDSLADAVNSANHGPDSIGH